MSSDQRIDLAARALLLTPQAHAAAKKALEKVSGVMRLHAARKGSRRPKRDRRR